MAIIFIVGFGEDAILRMYVKSNHTLWFQRKSDISLFTDQVQINNGYQDRACMQKNSESARRLYGKHLWLEVDYGGTFGSLTPCIISFYTGKWYVKLSRNILIWRRQTWAQVRSSLSVRLAKLPGAMSTAWTEKQRSHKSPAYQY